jgi:hypothetical protein
MPGKGRITLQIIGPSEALGWSWLFPPYRWHFSARSIDITDAVCFGARSLRDYAKRITILAMTWLFASDASSWSVYRQHGHY